MRTVVLRAGRVKPLAHGHPWVHADSVAELREAPPGAPPAPDDLVAVAEPGGRVLGVGLLSPTSLLRVRLLTHAPAAPDLEVLLDARLHAAAALRRRLFADPSRTDAYRLVHAEGDGLPGLVVDRFGPVLVAQFATAPMARRRAWLAERLLAASGAESLVARPGGHEEEEGLDPAQVPFEAGTPVPATLWVREEGLAVLAAPREGQKTGHYTDQRENRRLVGEAASGGELLDLFCGTGGFALQALAQGARAAHAVDASARALEAALAQARQNGLTQGLTTEKGDARAVLAALRSAGRRFDVVVLDPPNLFPRRGPPGAALKGYRELNVQALLRVRPGGLLATFTCSGRLSRDGFLDLVRAAALEAHTEVAVLRELAQGPDHPWLPAAPEGRYLTGFLLRVGRERA